MSDSTSGGPPNPTDPFAAKPYIPPTWANGNQNQPPAPEEPAPNAAPGSAEQTDGTPHSGETPQGESSTVETADGQQSVSDETEASEPTVEVLAEPFTHRYGTAGNSGAPGQPAARQDMNATQEFPPWGPAAETTPPKQKKKRGRKLIAAIAVLLLGLAGGIGGAAGYEALTDGDNAISSLDSKSAADSTPAGAIETVAQSLLPSVVQINVKGGSAAGSGTGIIISSDGQILTNNHVVEAAADKGTITVSFSDNSITSATILGRDTLTDLAVIKAEKTGLTPAKLGNSATLKVGQEVVAIGSPFGLESTVTSGIVSALNRPVSPSDGTDSGPSTVFPAIQTDAAINPGNSGGPLVDLNGEVVGINSAIRSSPSISGEAGSIGLGFAIPIDLAKSVSKSLVNGDKVEHARIGLTVKNAVDGDGITAVGAEVKKVTAGSAGAKAGLKIGDILTGLNGRPIGSADALVSSIRGFSPGDKVEITFRRGDKTETTEAILDSDGGKLSP